MFSQRYLDISSLFLIKEAKNNFEIWYRLQQKHHGGSLPSREQFLQQNIKKYLLAIKPIVYRVNMIKQVLKNPNIHLFSSDLTCQQLNIFVNAYKANFPDVDWLQKLEVMAGQPNKNEVIITDIKQFEENAREPIYRMDVLEKPNNEELRIWGMTTQIQSCKIKSKVIHGLGIGAKNLGMPTANLQNTADINRMLLDYPSAIYIVDVQLHGQTYRGAMNIGTNPHVQDSQDRKLEVYICHQFSEDFYQQPISVTLRRLIRLEAKFPSFDSFIHSMHNDIHVARSCVL